MHTPPTPVVSIVVAASDAERTICAAIESVLNQSIPNIELLICDDASRDDTTSRIHAFNDSRITLLVNEENRGPGASRDRAIAQATAPWVAFLDADDAWHPTRLERMLAATTYTHADVAFDDVMVCHDTDAGLVQWTPIHGFSAFGGSGRNPRMVDIGDYITSERLLVKAMVCTDFIRARGIKHSARRFAEDAEFHLRLGHAGAKFLYIPEPLYLYRITPGSLTAEARDPSLMRRCLEDCVQWQGWTASALAAFEDKIAALRRNESLYAFVRHIREGNLSLASNVVTQDPALLRAMPARLFHQLRYQIHRAMNGGRRRRIDSP